MLGDFCLVFTSLCPKMPSTRTTNFQGLHEASGHLYKDGKASLQLSTSGILLLTIDIGTIYDFSYLKKLGNHRSSCALTGRKGPSWLSGSVLHVMLPPGCPFLALL